MEDSLGVKNPSKSQLLILGCPVGPYYPTGFSPVSLSCGVGTIRSAPGGTGSFKVGGYKNINIETMDLHWELQDKQIREVINKFYGFMKIVKLSKLVLRTYFLYLRVKMEKKQILLLHCLKI